jgi:hypothetical protein
MVAVARLVAVNNVERSISDHKRGGDREGCAKVSASAHALADQFGTILGIGPETAETEIPVEIGLPELDPRSRLKVSGG